MWQLSAKLFILNFQCVHSLKNKLPVVKPLTSLLEDTPQGTLSNIDRHLLLTHTLLTCRRYSSGYHGGHQESHSYSHTHTTSFGSYKFIAMDACPSPGPRRPFNFFGVLHDVRSASFLWDIIWR